jgi:hypothetical protein
MLDFYFSKDRCGWVDYNQQGAGTSKAIAERISNDAFNSIRYESTSEKIKKGITEMKKDITDIFENRMN